MRLRTRLAEHIPRDPLNGESGMAKIPITNHVRQTGYQTDHARSFKILYRPLNAHALALTEFVAA